MESFGKYQLIRKLGAGGMAEVHLAREPMAGGLAKILVIKKIHPTLAEAPQFRQMFEDEAKVAVNLNHPNIVQTFSYGQIGPTFFLAMEHVEGVDLLRVLNAAVEKKQRIPPGLCAYLVQQVAKGLDYAHRKSDEYGDPFGIVHRDISPQNVLVSWDGMVKIVDFGIARARHVREEEGVVKGKFAYMSPEQASGLPVDARSDIFATGILLWELATCRALFGHLKGKQAINAIKAAQVPRPRSVDPELPEALEDIIMKALERRPEDRYQTARDLHRALGKFFFELSAREGKIFESGTMAAFIAQVLPKDARQEAPTPRPRNEGAQEADTKPQAASTDDRVPQFSEQRHVIVVEGELSGLAALRRQVGEDRAREALLDFLRVAEHVAYKHRSSVDRLDERGFTYLIGIPTAAEDDPSRGIQFALALIDALEGISRELPIPLRLAVGVQRGVALVSRGPAGSDRAVEYKLMGHAGPLAERLAKEAMPGEVLVGGGVYRGARADWRFEELDAIEMPAGEPGDSMSTLSTGPLLGGGIGSDPGLSIEDGGEPPRSRARVYRLLGARPRAERIDARAPRKLIGREPELEELRKAYRSVVKERIARHVTVVGDAGVGKRTLVDAFRAELDPATHFVLRTVGRAKFRESPYGVIADLARDLLDIPDEAEPREIKRRLESAVQLVFAANEAREARLTIDTLGPLLGVKVAGGDEIDPGERRRRIYMVTRRLQQRLAETRTLVIVVEDLQWVDTQSLDIFRALLEDPLDRPILGIATARDEDRIADLSTARRSHRIVTGELSVQDRATLAHARFTPDPAVDPLIAQILDRAGGNPFYINEIIDSLRDRGILTASDDGLLRWTRRDAPILVPTTVEAVVASRIDRLPEIERDAIRRAAVLGRVFRADDLAAMLGRDATDAIAALVMRGLVMAAAQTIDLPKGGPGVFAFRNLITLQVAYDSLAPSLRAELHRICADRLLASTQYRKGADDARLAEHLEAAGDPTAAARALTQAGLLAKEHAGNAQAFDLFTRALSLLPLDAHADRYQTHGERELILRGWGKRTNQLREIHAMRRAAHHLGDPEREAQALARLGLLYLEVGKYTHARRELDRALSVARAANDSLGEAEALRLCATLDMHEGHNHEALETAYRALSALGTSSDRATLLCRAQTLNAVGNIHVHTGHLRDAVSSYAEALVIYRRIGTRRLEGATLNNMGWVFVGLGEYEEALRHYKRSLRIAQDLGDRAGVGTKLANIGQTYTDLGDYDRAHRYLDKSIELHEALHDQPGLADALVTLAQVCLREHKIPETIAALERGLALASETRNRYQEIRALVYLSFARVERGDNHDAALELARSATRLAQDAGIVNGEVYGLCAEATALRALGRNEESFAITERAVSLLDSGREIDAPEEVLLIHAGVAKSIGRHDVHRTSIAQAYTAVQKKAARLTDPMWRDRYLAAPPAREIVRQAKSEETA